MNREHPASEQASALDVVQKAVYRIWGGFYGKMFLVTFFLSILVHLYMFTNKFANHDDVNGMLGSFFLAIAVVAVLQLFDIKHWVSGSLIALTMVSFPTVASTFSYMFCSYQYLFALAMASIAAILIRKCRFLPALLGALLLAIGMGCYQAYFTFTVALLLLTYVFDLLDNRWQGKGGMALGVGFFYLVFLINAMILYMLILKICLLVQHKSLTGYQGIDEMGTLGATSFLTRIGHGYGALQPFYQRMLHEMIYVILAAFVLFIIYKIVANRLYRSPLSMVLLVVALGLLPLACASIYLMTDIQTIHMVMLYALVLPTILPALMASKCHLSLASI